MLSRTVSLKCTHASKTHLKVGMVSVLIANLVSLHHYNQQMRTCERNRGHSATPSFSELVIAQVQCYMRAV